jgi:hypothetical protein
VEIFPAVSFPTADIITHYFAAVSLFTLSPSRPRPENFLKGGEPAADKQESKPDPVFPFIKL